MLDTLSDIANSMNAALRRLGFAAHPTDAYRYFVGDGMDCLARRVLPEERLDDETVSKCISAAKDEYRKHWADDTKPYKGISELLDELEKIGLPKVVLSNKPDDFTQIIVDKMLGAWSFQIVRGARPNKPKKPDPTTAIEIAEELKISPKEFLYLGDTGTDMQTANSAGMYAVGALWGFRSAEELRGNGAKVLVGNPEDILNLLNDRQT